MSTIPLTDAPLLAPARRRTLAVRAALGLVVLGAIVVATLAARDPHSRTVAQLPTNSDAIVVLDMSASISSDTFSRIGQTLSELAESDGRYGLVVFSDQAYEALPPGSPASGLAPLVRYFTLPPDTAGGFAREFPANPWSRSFSGGTKLSAGLALAHDIALRGRERRTGVVLVSDLDDDPQDVPRLGAILLAYRRDGIPVRIVALNASSEDAALFRRVLGPSAVVPTGDGSSAAAAPRNHTPTPWALVVAAIVAAVALATLEIWSPRLEWGRAR
jgi:hypothetical protein